MVTLPGVWLQLMRDGIPQLDRVRFRRALALRCASLICVFSFVLFHRDVFFVLACFVTRGLNTFQGIELAT